MNDDQTKKNSDSFKTALVTGAGRGLGKALAETLAKKGLTVVLVARNQSEVEAAAAGIRARGGKAHALVFDVSDKLRTHEMALLAASLAGPVDLLVHNASSLGPVPMPLLLDTECEDLSTVLETNLVGPFRLTKAVAGNMVLKKHGAVVFVSSDAAVSAYPGWGSYGVSKAASDHLARTFAAELGDQGVRVFAVDPGEMDTAMHKAALPDADPATLARPAHVAAAIAEMILGARRAENGARVVASEWGNS